MDIKQEVEEDSEIMDEIVNDIKTMDDDDEHAENEDDTADEDVEKSLNRIVKTELDTDVSFNQTDTSYSFENCNVSIASKADEEKDTENGELDSDSNVMKDEDFITDASVKMEAEIYQHTDDSLDIVGNEDNGFDLECMDKVDNDFMNGKGPCGYSGSDNEESDSGKVDKFFREVSDNDFDYGHETDSYDEEEYGSKIGVVIKKEKSDDFEQVADEDLLEAKDKNIDYGRKTKKAKNHVCDFCSRAFTSDNRLTRHKKHLHSDGRREEKPTKEGKYFCEVCNKRFISQSRLRLHTVTHTGEKPFSCDFCGQKFSHPTNKRRHMKTHTGDKPFVCLFCGKSFPVKHYLKDHMVKHTGEKPHECKLCFMTFAHRFSLKQHELLKHPGGEVNFKDTYEDRPFSCEICDKKFTQHSSLKIHVRLHTGSKPYKCTECEASFIRSDSLLRHKFEHSGQRPFRCDTCEKTFTSAYILKQHRNVHTGDRRQQCEHCGVELANKESLARHMMRHTGESLLECKSCHKKFISEQSLKKHQAYPCKEKIHECKECDYKNNSESKLKRHMLKHNAQKLLECKICKNKFTYPSNLKRHMKVHEKEHEKKTRKKETLISNDDVGKFIAESMKDIETEKTGGMKLKIKRTKKNDKRNRVYSEDAVNLFRHTDGHGNEFDESNKNFNLNDTNEHSNNCIDGGKQFLATKSVGFEPENGYAVVGLKQKRNKDVKMKAFYTSQYYEHIAKLKGQDSIGKEPSEERMGFDNFVERDSEHADNVKLNPDIDERSNYSYVDEIKKVTTGGKCEGYKVNCDNKKNSNLNILETCQSSTFDLGLGQNVSNCNNLAYKNYGSVDSNYRPVIECQQGKDNENVSGSDVESGWSSFSFHGVHVQEKDREEIETVNKYSLKLPSVSLSSYSSIDNKVLPAEDILNSASRSQYSAVPYNPALLAGKLPAFAGSFYSHHHMNTSRNTIPSDTSSFGHVTLQCEDHASISTRNQALVQDVLKRLYSHQRGEDESNSSID